MRQRVALQEQVVAVRQPIDEAAVEDEEAAADAALRGQRLFLKLRDAAALDFQLAEAAGRLHRRHRAQLAVAEVEVDERVMSMSETPSP